MAEGSSRSAKRTRCLPPNGGGNYASADLSYCQGFTRIAHLSVADGSPGRPSTNSGSGGGDRVHVGRSGGSKLGGELPEQSDTVEAGPVGRQRPGRQPGVEVRDHAPVVEGAYVSREGLPVVHAAADIRVPLQEAAVQPGESIEVPPPSRSLCGGARETRR